MRLIDADKIPYLESVNDSSEGTGIFFARREVIDTLPTIDEKEEVKRLEKHIDELDAVIRLKEDVIRERQHENELRFRDGIIYGLKYAIRYHGTGGDNNS